MKKILLFMIFCFFSVTNIMGDDLHNELSVSFYLLYTDAEYKPLDLSGKDNKENLSPQNLGLSYYYVTSDHMRVGLCLSYNSIFKTKYSTYNYDVDIKSTVVMIQPSIKVKFDSDSNINILVSSGIAIFNTKYSFTSKRYYYNGSSEYSNKRLCFSTGLEYNPSTYKNIQIPLGIYYDIYNLSSDNNNPLLDKTFSDKESIITGIRLGIGIVFCFN